MSTGSGSDVLPGFGLALKVGENGNLTANLGLVLGPSLRSGVGVDTDNVVNLFSGSCLDIFRTFFLHFMPSGLRCWN